ncbi:MAG: zinc dependent phospholipase C family protein [Oscillospiraceae bacterium]|jgi:hypothetical protein
MPSLLTHHLLGRRVLTQNGWSYPTGSDEYDAFTMGCQGPDPFFFTPKLDQPTRYIRFGQLLHSVHVTACFGAMRRYTKRQSGKERSILEAYLTGYLCHYVLDRTAHPYVYAVQYRECEKHGAAKDIAHVHARLETVIDSLLTGQYQTPDRLMPNNRGACMAIGRMYRQVAQTVYGILLPESCFWTAMCCMRSAEWLLKSRYGVKRAVLTTVERMFHRYSYYEAMSHSRDTKGLADPLNQAHKEWLSPADGAIRNESFQELFETAADLAGEKIALFRTGAPAAEITNGIQFDGGPEQNAR